MSKTSTPTHRSAPLHMALTIAMLIVGAALVILWSRVVVLSSPANLGPVSALATPPVTRSVEPTVAPSLAIPTGTPQPTATPTRQSPLPTPDDIDPRRCKEPAGQIVVGTFFSNISGADERFRVYLPPCYDRTDARYPTLYLIHGSADDDTHWEHLGLFDVMNEGLRADRFSPAIIVLPDGDYNLYMNTSGGPRSYEGQMVDELIPLIDGSYRTDTRREMRAIGGISRGGVWALEIGFLHPDLFAIVGGHSAALNVNLAPPVFDPLAMADKPGLKTQRIWLDAGDTDYVQPGVEQLHQALEQHDVPHVYQIWPGAHDDSLWAAHLSDYLEFYTQTWPRQ